jgi:hypothetical protein
MVTTTSVSEYKQRDQFSDTPVTERGEEGTTGGLWAGVHAQVFSDEYMLRYAHRST